MSGIQVKHQFFDKKSIIAAMDKRSRKALGKIGAILRRTAKSSLKYTEGPSSPGSPPHVHRGGRFTRQTKDRKTGQMKAQAASPLRELIFFSLDTRTMSVVCGPTIFRKVNTVARALEQGGQITVTQVLKRSPARRTVNQRQADRYRELVQSGAIIVPKSIRVRRTISIAARPTMVPAMASNVPKFAECWKE